MVVDSTRDGLELWLIPVVGRLYGNIDTVRCSLGASSGLTQRRCFEDVILGEPGELA